VRDDSADGPDFRRPGHGRDGDPVGEGPGGAGAGGAGAGGPGGMGDSRAGDGPDFADLGDLADEEELLALQAALARNDPDDEPMEPLSPHERAEVLADLEDLEVFEALLEPRGVRGLVVDCDDCREPHYFAWELLRSNLRHLLDAGQTRVHEPAFAPDPADYVSWDYARGYVDATYDANADTDD
jgi:hypothetical protein